MVETHNKNIAGDNSRAEKHEVPIGYEIPKFLQYVTGMQKVEKIIDPKKDDIGVTFRKKETILTTQDVDGVKTTRDVIVKHHSPLNIVDELYSIEVSLVNELNEYRNEAVGLDVSVAYRRKKDIIDRRRKMSMESGDNELLELLDGNLKNLLDDLNIEVVTAFIGLFSKMELNGYDYVLVSPEVATLLKTMEIFNSAKPDLMNMTSVVPEGNIKNIMVFTNMICDDSDRWMMYFGTSRFQNKTFSVINNLTYTTTIHNQRFPSHSVVRVDGGDAKKSMTIFAKALPKYSLESVRSGEHFSGLKVEPSYEAGDVLGRIYPGMRSERTIDMKTVMKERLKNEEEISKEHISYTEYIK